MQGTVALFSFHACCPRVVLEEWVQPTELVGGNNSDEVLNDLLGREIAESLKRLLRPSLMEGWVSWESMYDPTMSQTLPPPFPPILTSEIFRHLDSDVAEVIFPLGQTQFGPCCYEDLAQHLLGDHAQLRFAKAQYPGFQVYGKVCLYDL